MLKMWKPGLIEIKKNSWVQILSLILGSMTSGESVSSLNLHLLVFEGETMTTYLPGLLGGEM